jgi:hypothetical protein
LGSAAPRSTATSTPPANLWGTCVRGRLPLGNSLLVLRLHHQTVQQGRGPIHGADVCRLPGRPWPWQRPVSGHDPSRAARRSGAAPELGARAEGSRQPPVIAVMRQRLAAGEQVARMDQEPGLAWLERQAEVAEGWSASAKRASATTEALVAHLGRCCVKQARPLLDQQGCRDRGSDLGVWCRCVSAAAGWLQSVRRPFAACGCVTQAVTIPRRSATDNSRGRTRRCHHEQPGRSPCRRFKGSPSTSQTPDHAGHSGPTCTCSSQAARRECGGSQSRCWL